MPGEIQPNVTAFARVPNGGLIVASGATANRSAQSESSRWPTKSS
jgi:hypothetical protein